MTEKDIIQQIEKLKIEIKQKIKSFKEEISELSEDIQLRYELRIQVLKEKEKELLKQLKDEQWKNK